MTQDGIIEMAKQAGMSFNQSLSEFSTPLCDGVEIEDLEAFAKLVAAKERNEILDSFSPEEPIEKWVDKILARGEA